MKAYTIKAWELLNITVMRL